MKILELITENIKYLIMIVGVIEFMKGIVKDIKRKKPFKPCRIAQVVLSFVAGFSHCAKIGESCMNLFDIAFNSLLLLSLSSLFYDYILKKIKKEKENV